MTKTIREDSENMPRPRSNVSCYLCIAFTFSLTAALLGAYFQRARGVGRGPGSVPHDLCAGRLCVPLLPRPPPHAWGSARRARAAHTDCAVIDIYVTGVYIHVRDSRRCEA